MCIPLHMRPIWRPNHVKLIDKIYPSAPIPKANASELSYLTFYAAAKPAKLVKIGESLYKRVNRAVRSRGKKRQSCVLVTLDAVKALVVACKDHLIYFNPYALRIMKTALLMNDPEVLARAVVTFSTLSIYFDGSSLLTQPAQAEDYMSIIERFASYAKTQGVTEESRITRYFGLGGLQAAVTSNAIFHDGQTKHNQVQTAIPALLSNISPENGVSLSKLVEHVLEDDPEKKQHTRDETFSSVPSNSSLYSPQSPSFRHASRRMSLNMSTGAPSTDDIAFLAFHSLKQFFRRSPNPTIRQGMFALFKWLDDCSTNDESGGWKNEDWNSELVLIIISWEQVPARYIPPMAILDTLVSILSNDKHQLSETTPNPKYTTLLAMLLRALTGPIPLNGLSVMDVLNTLLAIIIRRLQILFGSDDHKINTTDSSESPPRVVEGNKKDIGASPDKSSDWLLGGIIACIGGLASQVSYSNQVSDIVVELIGRLEWSNTRASQKSPRNSKFGPQKKSLLSTARWSGLGMRGAGTGMGVIAALGDQAIPLAEGRKVALECISAVLKVSQSSTQQRHRVPLDVWEDITGMIADPDYGVRLAYSKAMLSYLTNPVNTFKTDNFAVNERFLIGMFIGLYDLALLPENSTQDFFIIVNVLEQLSKSLGATAIVGSVPLIFGLQDAAKSDTRVISASRRAAIASSIVVCLEKLAVTNLGLEKSLGKYAGEIKRDKKEAKEWAQFIEAVCKVDELPLTPTVFESVRQDLKLPRTVNCLIDRNIVVSVLLSNDKIKTDYHGDLKSDLNKDWSDVLALSILHRSSSAKESIARSSSFSTSDARVNTLDTKWTQPTKAMNMLVVPSTGDGGKAGGDTGLTTPTSISTSSETAQIGSSAFMTLDNHSAGQFEAAPVSVDNLREALGVGSIAPVKITEPIDSQLELITDTATINARRTHLMGNTAATATSNNIGTSAVGSGDMTQVQSVEGSSGVSTTTMRTRSRRVTRHDVKDLLDSISPAIKAWTELEKESNGKGIAGAIGKLNGAPDMKDLEKNMDEVVISVPPYRVA